MRTGDYATEQGDRRRQRYEPVSTHSGGAGSEQPAVRGRIASEPPSVTSTSDHDPCEAARYSISSMAARAAAIMSAFSWWKVHTTADRAEPDN